jgi:hypothetical protein
MSGDNRGIIISGNGGLTAGTLAVGDQATAIGAGQAGVAEALRTLLALEDAIEQHRAKIPNADAVKAKVTHASHQLQQKTPDKPKTLEILKQVMNTAKGVAGVFEAAKAAIEVVSHLF